MDPQTGAQAPTAPAKKKPDPFLLTVAGFAALFLLGTLLSTFGGPSVRAHLPYTPEGRIAGKWEGVPREVTYTAEGEQRGYEDTPPSVEFLPDGTYIANGRELGRYRFLDGERLTLTPPIRDDSEPLMRVKFNGPRMALMGTEETLTYRRP